MPSISTSTISPGRKGETPDGVPVMMISPGSRVMTCETKEMSWRVEKIISLVFESCLTFPLTRTRMLSSSGFYLVTLPYPMRNVTGFHKSNSFHTFPTFYIFFKKKNNSMTNIPQSGNDVAELYL